MLLRLVERLLLLLLLLSMRVHVVAGVVGRRDLSIHKLLLLLS